jgi:1,4-dihydroxy-2-naphthoyl-CoA hydrolase
MADALETVNERLKGFFPDTIGVRVTVAEPDRVVAEVDVTRGHCTVPGIMHGGAIMALADTLGGVATSLNLQPGYGTTTIESKTNFFSAGPEGTTVTAECTPLHKGRRTMVWETRVVGPDGRLVAKVTQTQMVLEPR